MKDILAGLALSVALLGSAAAQSLYSDTSIMSDFAVQNVTKALQQLGYTYRQTSSQPTEIEVDLQSPRGKMILRPECNPGATGKISCPGLTIYIVMPPTGTMQSINAFNGRNDAASVFAIQVDPQSEAIVLKRYLSADHGMPFGSFKGNINRFRGAYIDWLRFSGSVPTAPGP